MKKCLKLLALLLSLNVFSQTHNLVFVGYINNIPVFDAYKEHKLYLLKDKPEFLQDYPKEYNVEVVHDTYIVYSSKDKLLVSENGNQQVYTSTSSVMVINNDGAVYVTDKDGAIKILKSGIVSDTGLKGWVVSIHDGFLYYNTEHDPEIIHANADLYKVDIKTLENPEKIVENISGEETVIYPGGKYIYDEILHDGWFRPVIYSVGAGKYHKLFSIPKEYMAHIPFYSITDNCLVFYSSFDVPLLKIPLPTDFTFERPKEE